VPHSIVEAIGVITEKLDRLHSRQFTLGAQVKDLRESLPVQHRPLSRWLQEIHVQVLNTKRAGCVRPANRFRYVTQMAGYRVASTTISS
jgi:hypothetical protein